MSTTPDPDGVLVGAGITSTTVGVPLRELNPALRIELHDVLDSPAREGSSTGTRHAGRPSPTGAGTDLRKPR